MNVLFSTNLPSPYRVEFFDELGKKCNLTVAYERSIASNRNGKWNNSRKDLSFQNVVLKGIDIGEESSLSLELIKIIKKNNFDVIVISGYSSPTAMITILYLVLHRIPFIMSSDGGLISSENQLKYYLKKFFISKASLWLSTGIKTSEYLKYYGAESNKIRIYPFTSIREEEIQVKCTDKEYYRTKLGISEEKIVLSVGQFIHRKGYDVLLRACTHLDESIGVYIVGGDPTDEYKYLKEELKLKNVHFIGFQSKETLKDYYRAADIFVLPTREDIWGLVINEAMSYSLPVITTNKCVAGTELIIDGHNGYLVPVEDSIAIAARIKNIFEDEILLNQMGTQSLKTISKYTIENMAEINYLEISKFASEKLSGC